MRPSEVRGHMLAEHARLAALLRDAGRCAWRVLDGKGDGAVRSLSQAVLALDEPLRRHLWHEHALLAGALDLERGLGPNALLDLQVTHAAQGELLSALVELALLSNDVHGTGAAPPPRAYALHVVEFVRELVKEMEREELELLRPEALREDAHP